MGLAEDGRSRQHRIVGHLKRCDPSEANVGIAKPAEYAGACAGEVARA